MALNNNLLEKFKTECVSKPELKGAFQRMLKTGLAFLELQYKTASRLHLDPANKLTKEEEDAFLASRQAFHDAKYELLESCVRARMTMPFFTIDEVRQMSDVTAAH